MKTRREFVKLMSGMGLGVAAADRLYAQDSEPKDINALLSTALYSEEHMSDPDASPEKLDFAPAQLQKAITTPRPYGQNKNARDLAMRMLEITRTFANDGVSRDHNSSQVLEFLQLFGFGLRYDGGGAPVPYCAAGVSYAACRAYCDIKTSENYKVKDITYDDARMNLLKSKLRDVEHYYFLPSPSVAFIKADAEEKSRKTWVDATQTPSRGWLVIFSWRSTRPNHVGIVDRVDDKNLYTLEYNTTGKVNGDQRNGGMVAPKIRPRDNTIMGFVKLY